MSGPWDKYAAPAESAPVANGPWTKFANAGKSTEPEIDMSHVAGAGPGTLPQPSAHPAVDMQSSVLSPTPYLNRVEDTAKSLIKPWLHPFKSVASYPGFVDPSKQGGPIQDIVDNPDKGEGIANALTDTGTGLALGGMTKLVPEHGPIEGTRRLLSSGVDDPIPGEGETPRERFETAKRYGVNLNAADATNNPILRAVRHVGENSLLGGSTYDAARASNVGALQTAANTTLDAMSPLSREEGGRLMQSNLESDRAGLESKAGDRYQDLSEAMGDRPIDGSESLGTLAQNIRDQETPFNEKYPHLVPKQAMGIINDVADRFKPGEPVKSSLLDEFGKPIYTAPPPPVGLTYPEAQNIRSRTMDVTRRTNDLTADRGIGMLKQIVGGADDAITNSAGGLTPSQLEIYRDANQKFAEMKDKYDNPQSPLYSAIRTDNPSSLTKGVGQKTPEQVRNLIPRLGPEGTGAMQRGVAENAMGTDANGNRNLAGFGKRLYQLPEDYRQELFQPNPLFAGEHPPMSDDFHQPLKDVASISNALSKDLNPSGSGKLGQKVVEGSMLLHPFTMAEPLLQYPAAKLMHSPRAIDWLMKPKLSTTPRSPLFAPVIGANSADTSKKKGLYGTR